MGILFAFIFVVVPYVLSTLLLLGMVSALFGVCVKAFDAGRLSAIVISAVVSVLCIPTVLIGHGIAVVPLAIGGLAGGVKLVPFGWLAFPVIGTLVYFMLKGVWKVIARCEEVDQ